MSMVKISINELTSELMQFKRMNKEERVKQTISRC